MDDEDVFNSNLTWRVTEKTLKGLPHAGLPAGQAAVFRQAYCELIKDAGRNIPVPQLTIATAAVFAHRFYARSDHNDDDNRRQVIAAACLFLAAKVEETPKRLEVVLTAVVREALRGADAAARAAMTAKDRLEALRIEVLSAEIRLLFTLGFDFTVCHAYRYLAPSIRALGLELTDESKAQLYQHAWSFANDSVRTLAALRHDPRTIAAACIYLASKLEALSSPQGSAAALSGDGQSWARALRVTSLDDVLAVCDAILTLYDPETAGGMLESARAPWPRREAAVVTETEGGGAPHGRMGRHTRTRRRRRRRRHHRHGRGRGRGGGRGPHRFSRRLHLRGCRWRPDDVVAAHS